jgi:Rieske Fe-S protein
MKFEVQDRRSFLARAVTSGLALIGAALAALVGLAAAPRARKTGRRWQRTISVFDVPPERPIASVIAERQADGWYETRKQSVVFIDRDGDSYQALSATCSHLGCRVRWDATSELYLCPCHGGAYDRSGRVVAGPPPLPLQRLAVRVNPQTSDIEVEL